MFPQVSIGGGDNRVAIRGHVHTQLQRSATHKANLLAFGGIGDGRPTANTWKWPGKLLLAFKQDFIKLRQVLHYLLNKRLKLTTAYYHGWNQLNASNLRTKFVKVLEASWGYEGKRTTR